MPKHRSREPFKSFFGSHVDPEKDEELRENQSSCIQFTAEIENKVQKILNLVKEEDNDEKETLFTLVKDFNNHYLSLYDSYDQLTKELRNIAHSSSSSSDSSDSDSAPTKKGKKNGKVEKQFDSTIAGSKQGLEVALLEVDDLKRKLTVTVGEKKALSFEYQNALSKAQEADRIVMDLNAELEAAKMEILTLKEKLELAENDILKLNQMQKTIEEEKDSQFSALLEKLEHQDNQIAVLSTRKNEMHLILEKSGEISEFLGQIESMKDELSSKSIEMERLMEMNENLHQDLKILQHEKSELETTVIDLETKFQNCEENLKSSEAKIEKMAEQFQNDSDLKNQEIYNLEEKIEDLNQELEMKTDEISTLVENMRTTEVKHRLTSQKLHITEQLLNETEESQMGKVVKLSEDKKELEERIGIMSGIIATYKRNQLNMVAEIKNKVNETVIGIDTLGMKFEEDYGHLDSHVFYIVNELQGIKARITVSNVEKGQLKREISCLMKEELTLKEKIQELEKVLERGEHERISLQQIVKEKEEKLRDLERTIGEQVVNIGEMERKMDEKDDRYLSLSEEKREAIRQLCVWIDYHQKRYEGLKDMILKSRGSK